MTGALERSNAAYAVAKIAGIELINAYRKEYGFQWISLMPTNLYGPFDNFKKEESHVLPSFIRRFVEAVDQNLDSVTMWGSGEPLREFLHADDLASAVIMASQNYDSELHLNIGTGDEISIKNLAELVARAAGYSGRIEWDTSKLDGTPRKVLDVSRVKSLGWTPRIGLTEGIASMVIWYREARSLGVARI
jgi:GDP-L-fucose synthase